MNYRWITAAFLGCLGGLMMGPPVFCQTAANGSIASTAPAPPALTAREILLQTDHNGLLLQRVTADIAGTRWVWRSEGTLLFYEETAVAGGYVEKQRILGSPVEDLTHIAGCEAGPVVIGPISFKGIYHRVLDPAAGGTDWSALTDRNAVRLDRALQRGRWTGVSLLGTLPFSFFGGELTPGIVWSTDDEVELAAAVLPLRWPEASIELSVARGAFSVATNDSWLFEAPPFRTDRVIQVGSALTLRPTVAEIPVELGVEGWQQRVAYRPPRYSFQASCRAPGRFLAIASRATSTNSGFRALTGRRTRSAELLGVTISEGRRVQPWIWKAAWDRRAGWEHDRPAASVDTYSGKVGLAWRRGITRLVRVGATTDSRGTHSLDYRVRFAAGPTGLLAFARHTFDHPTGGDRFSATTRLSLRTDFGRHRRRFSTSAGWKVTAENHRWEQGVTADTSIPVGLAFRLELSAKATVFPEVDMETVEWQIRLRNTGPNRRSRATTPE